MACLAGMAGFVTLAMTLIHVMGSESVAACNKKPDYLTEFAMTLIDMMGSPEGLQGATVFLQKTDALPRHDTP